MMTALVQGRKLSEADELATRFTRLMHGDDRVAPRRALGDLRALQGVSRVPVRIKCALLGFDALLEALKRTGYTVATPHGPELPRGPAAPGSAR
jgi:nitrogen fixation NifU-like protein